MKIKEEVFKPFYIESNYHGHQVIEVVGGKDAKVGPIYPLNNLQAALQEIVKRKLAAIDDTVTFQEYIKKEADIVEGIRLVIEGKTTDEKIVETAEQIANVEQLT